MLALQKSCRWICIMLFFKIIIFVIVISFIINLPTVYKVVHEDVAIEYTPYKYGFFRELSEREMVCLADNIFFESRNQSDLGKKAVAYVTLNRLSSSKFPDNLCNIVYAKKGKVCQFSWTCKNLAVRSIKNREMEMWQRSMSIANQAVFSYNISDDPTIGASHFHADYVKPFWSSFFHRTVTIDNHLFYRPRYGT